MSDTVQEGLLAQSVEGTNADGGPCLFPEVVRRMMTGAILAIATLVGLGAPAAHSQGFPGVEAGGAIESAFMTGAGPSSVSWRARVMQPGGRFDLYSGGALDRMQVVATAAANPGIDLYQYHQRPLSAPIVVFQLRFTDSVGTEHVLATTVAYFHGFDDTPPWVSPTETSPKAALPAPAGMSRASTRLVGQAAARLPDAAAPPPEVPPPRACASA